MSKTNKLQNPYINNYTLEQVHNAEAGNYTIQVGDDFFSYNGKMAFSLDRAQYFYEQVLNGLYDLLENGDAMEQQEAYRCILMINITPLRIH